MKEFAIKHKALWIITFLMAAASHGSMLLSRSIGIDTEDIITLKSFFYDEWLSMGREGLVVLKILFNNYTFNPYFVGVGTLAALTLTCFLWNYLFYYITNKENTGAMVCFNAFFLFSTILTEQLYFKLQAFEVSIGFALVAGELILLVWLIEQKWNIKSLLYLAVIAANFILFSLYQVFVALFIFGVVVIFFLGYFVSDRWKDKDNKALWGMAGKSIGVFLISFIINQIITGLFFSNGSDYLANQMSWFTQRFKDCLINIYWHVRDVELGRNMYYSKALLIFEIVLVIFTIFYIKHNKARAGKILAVLDVLMIIGAPFYMTLLLGKMPVIRSQLVLPFSVAFASFVVWLIVEENIKSKVAVSGLVVVCFIACFIQLQDTLRLNYTDQVRYDSDVRVAENIINKINELEDETHSIPVIFFGKQPAKLNNSCVMGDAIGYSFFEWDADVDPKGFFSTRRILGFMHTLGENYAQAPLELMEGARSYSIENMKAWPMEGSVSLYEGVIIVKLSE